MFNLEYIRHADRFFALQVPIYYYVKTKGSLASQGMSITKTIKMKSMVFECYNDFYRDVLEEEEYEKKRLQVYRFLVDAAGDGIVPFTVFPGTKRLGEERSSVWREAVDGEGILSDFYRERKLLEHYLEAAALQHDLALYDIKLLLALRERPQIGSYKELADFANLSRGRLAVSLQKLGGRELVRIEEVRGKGIDKIIVRTADLPEAEIIMHDIETAVNDYKRARFAEFQEEECRQYEILSDRIRENVQSVLRRK